MLKSDAICFRRMCEGAKPMLMSHRGSAAKSSAARFALARLRRSNERFADVSVGRQSIEFQWGR